ncbi:hypothetical protein PTKU46_36340 [Paraburkholderia terrae]|uniref:hypothetical protein n=1 Tax=Paraburkholderia terrae TaxID=311230 RepID=UPI0030DFDE29
MRHATPSGPLGDIDSLLHEIGKLGASQIGIVLKIETKVAFSRLPDLVLNTMRQPQLADRSPAMIWA